MPEAAPGKPQDGSTGQAVVTLRKDGGPPRQLPVPVGRDVPLTLPIDHGGPNILELAVEPGPRADEVAGVVHGLVLPFYAVKPAARATRTVTAASSPAVPWGQMPSSRRSLVQPQR